MGRKRQRKNSKSPKVTPEKCSKKQKSMDAFVQTTNADEMNAVRETVPDSDSDLARDPECEECEEKLCICVEEEESILTEYIIEQNIEQTVEDERRDTCQANAADKEENGSDIEDDKTRTDISPISVSTPNDESRKASGKTHDNGNNGSSLKLMTEKTLIALIMKVDKKQDRLMDNMKSMQDQMLQLNNVIVNQAKDIKSIQAEVGSMRKHIGKIEKDHMDMIVKAQEEIKAVQSQINVLSKEYRRLDKTVSDAPPNHDRKECATNIQIKELNEQINKIERKSRERNLRLVGYEEKHSEDCKTIVEEIIYMQLEVYANIETAHRTGKRQDHKPRHIIFRVQSMEQKFDILQIQKEKLKESGLFITEDLTRNDLMEKIRLKPVIDKAKQKGEKWKFKNGKLMIEGKIYKDTKENDSSSTSSQQTQKPAAKIQRRQHNPQNQKTTAQLRSTNNSQQKQLQLEEKRQELQRKQQEKSKIYDGQSLVKERLQTKKKPHNQHQSNVQHKTQGRQHTHMTVVDINATEESEDETLSGQEEKLEDQDKPTQE